MLLKLRPIHKNAPLDAYGACKKLCHEATKRQRRVC